MTKLVISSSIHYRCPLLIVCFTSVPVTTIQHLQTDVCLGLSYTNSYQYTTYFQHLVQTNVKRLFTFLAFPICLEFWIQQNLNTVKLVKDNYERIFVFVVLFCGHLGCGGTDVTFEA